MDEEKKDHAVRKALVMVSQVGISMITPVMLCGIIGYYMDRRSGASFWFILFVILGIMAAFRNVYYMLRKFYQKDLKEENERQRYENQLKEYSRTHGSENIDDLKVRRIRKRD